MNRRILAITAAFALPLGLAACGGDGASAEGQSVDEACAAIADPLNEAASSLNAVDPTDPEAATSALTTVADAYKSAVSSVTNTEVKSAVQTAEADLTAVTELMGKVLEDPASATEAELTAADQKMQASQNALLSLCGADE